MATRKLWLWIRQDGEPKVIEVGSKPAGPGKVLEMDGMPANEARALYRLAVEQLDTSDAELVKLSREGKAEALRRAGEIKAAQLSMRLVDLGSEVTRG